MEKLSKSQAQFLKEIKGSGYTEYPQGDEKGWSLVDHEEDYYDDKRKVDIDDLEAIGYVERFGQHVITTNKGCAYLEYFSETRKVKTWTHLCYWITTGLALASVVLALIALVS